MLYCTLQVYGTKRTRKDESVVIDHRNSHTRYAIDHSHRVLQNNFVIQLYVFCLRHRAHCNPKSRRGAQSLKQRWWSEVSIVIVSIFVCLLDLLKATVILFAALCRCSSRRDRDFSHRQLPSGGKKVIQAVRIWVSWVSCQVFFASIILFTV